MKSPFENIIVDRNGRTLDIRLPQPIFMPGLLEEDNQLERMI
jgi:hypothetical protein